MIRARTWNRDVMVCCENFAEALKNGTDNELYGPAVWSDDPDSWRIGSGLKPINFCPYCATPVKEFKEGHNDFKIPNTDG